MIPKWTNVHKSAYIVQILGVLVHGCRRLGARTVRERLPDWKLQQVARYYYIFGLTQQQIANRLGMGRSSVSRLLDEARRRGLVQIRVVTEPAEEDLELSDQLARHLGLREALVIRPSHQTSRLDRHAPADAGQMAREAVGRAAARYLETLLARDSVIAVSWGRTLCEMGRQFKPARGLGQGTVVSLMGGFGFVAPGIEAEQIVRYFSQATGFRGITVPAPALVTTQATQHALLGDPTVRRALETARQAEVAVFSVGEVGWSSTIYQMGWIGREHLHALVEAGAVGDILLRFFDREGRPLEVPHVGYAVGLSLGELRKIPVRICVAVGKEKLNALRAAAWARYYNVLITDSDTARKLLSPTGPKQMDAEGEGVLTR